METTKTNKKIVVFASGSGTNFVSIYEFLQSNKLAEVAALFTNKPNCGAAHHAQKFNIDVKDFTKETFEETVLRELLKITPDLIVLAGFLWKIPENIVKAFPNKIINIHPALLPKFGGKGMYGKQVHQAVFDNKEKESGITIHYVNEHYDEGNIIGQFKVALNDNDTPEIIEQKVRELELKHYPEIIQKLLT